MQLDLAISMTKALYKSEESASHSERSQLNVELTFEDGLHRGRAETLVSTSAKTPRFGRIG